MRVFADSEKVNFVDENNVFVGYSLSRGCCEQADWFVSSGIHNTQPSAIVVDPIEAAAKGVPYKPKELRGYVFDTSFFKEVDGGDFDGGGMAIFRVTNGHDEQFVHIFNSHNGYYGHGFKVTISGEVVRDGTL